MCFISVGRYLGIRNPLHARQANLFVSRRAVLWRIAIAWVASAFIASPITMMSLYDHRNIVPSPSECAISNRYFMIFGSLLAFFIPMFVMVPSYVMTVRLLSQRAKFVRSDSLLLTNFNHSASSGNGGGHLNHNNSQQNQPSAALNGPRHSNNSANGAAGELTQTSMLVAGEAQGAKLNSAPPPPAPTVAGLSNGLTRLASGKCLLRKQSRRREAPMAAELVDDKCGENGVAVVVVGAEKEERRQALLAEHRHDQMANCGHITAAAAAAAANDAETSCEIKITTESPDGGRQSSAATAANGPEGLVPPSMGQQLCSQGARQMLALEATNSQMARLSGEHSSLRTTTTTTTATRDPISKVTTFIDDEDDNNGAEEKRHFASNGVNLADTAKGGVSNNNSSMRMQRAANQIPPANASNLAPATISGIGDSCASIVPQVSRTVVSSSETTSCDNKVEPSLSVGPLLEKDSALLEDTAGGGRCSMPRPAKWEAVRCRSDSPSARRAFDGKCFLFDNDSRVHGRGGQHKRDTIASTSCNCNGETCEKVPPLPLEIIKVGHRCRQTSSGVETNVDPERLQICKEQHPNAQISWSQCLVSTASDVTPTNDGCASRPQILSTYQIGRGGAELSSCTQTNSNFEQVVVHIDSGHSPSSLVQTGLGLSGPPMNSSESRQRQQRQQHCSPEQMSPGARRQHCSMQNCAELCSRKRVLAAVADHERQQRRPPTMASNVVAPSRNCALETLAPCCKIGKEPANNRRPSPQSDGNYGGAGDPHETRAVGHERKQPSCGRGCYCSASPELCAKILRATREGRGRNERRHQQANDDDRWPPPEWAEAAPAPERVHSNIKANELNELPRVADHRQLYWADQAAVHAVHLKQHKMATEMDPHHRHPDGRNHKHHNHQRGGGCKTRCAQLENSIGGPPPLPLESCRAGNGEAQEQQWSRGGCSDRALSLSSILIAANENNNHHDRANEPTTTTPALVAANKTNNNVQPPRSKSLPSLSPLAVAVAISSATTTRGAKDRNCFRCRRPLFRLRRHHYHHHHHHNHRQRENNERALLSLGHNQSGCQRISVTQFELEAELAAKQIVASKLGCAAISPTTTTERASHHNRMRHSHCCCHRRRRRCCCGYYYYLCGRAGISQEIYGCNEIESNRRENCTDRDDAEELCVVVKSQCGLKNCPLCPKKKAEAEVPLDTRRCESAERRAPLTSANCKDIAGQRANHQHAERDAKPIDHHHHHHHRLHHCGNSNSCGGSRRTLTTSTRQHGHNCAANQHRNHHHHRGQSRSKSATKCTSCNHHNRMQSHKQSAERGANREHHHPSIDDSVVINEQLSGATARERQPDPCAQQDGRQERRLEEDLWTTEEERVGHNRNQVASVAFERLAAREMQQSAKDDVGASITTASVPAALPNVRPFRQILEGSNTATGQFFDKQQQQGGAGEAASFLFCSKINNDHSAGGPTSSNNELSTTATAVAQTLINTDTITASPNQQCQHNFRLTRNSNSTQSNTTTTTMANEQQHQIQQHNHHNHHHHHNQNQHQSGQNEPQMIRYLGSSMQVRSEQKATKVLGVVFFTFVFCWTPFFVINFTQGFVARETLSQWISNELMTTFLWLGYISSTINPVIYTVFNRNFRRAFRRLILCKDASNRQPFGKHASRSSEYYKSFKFNNSHHFHQRQHHVGNFGSSLYGAGHRTAGNNNSGGADQTRPSQVMLNRAVGGTVGCPTTTTAAAAANENKRHWRKQTDNHNTSSTTNNRHHQAMLMIDDDQSPSISARAQTRQHRQQQQQQQSRLELALTERSHEVSAAGGGNASSQALLPASTMSSPRKSSIAHTPGAATAMNLPARLLASTSQVAFAIGTVLRASTERLFSASSSPINASATRTSTKINFVGPFSSATPKAHTFQDA